MSSIKLKHASGNSMSIAAPATNPASDLSLKLPATIGTAGQVLRNSSTAGTLEFGGLGGGITHVDQWRVTSAFTGDAQPISSNLERCDTSAGLIGSAMTESSGVFTFPVTGAWRIEFNNTNYLNNSNSRYTESFIYKTQNDGTSWVECGRAGSSQYDSGSNTYANNYTQFLFDVTNVSTHKVKFEQVVFNNSVVTLGSTDHNWTYFTFTRLGDT